MARNSVKVMVFFNVEIILVRRFFIYFVVSKCIKLISLVVLVVVLFLNVCMDVRKILYGMKIDESKD